MTQTIICTSLLYPPSKDTILHLYDQTLPNRMAINRLTLYVQFQQTGNFNLFAQGLKDRGYPMIDSEHFQLLGEQQHWDTIVSKDYMQFKCRDDIINSQFPWEMSKQQNVTYLTDLMEQKPELIEKQIIFENAVVAQNSENKYQIATESHQQQNQHNQELKQFQMLECLERVELHLNFQNDNQQPVIISSVNQVQTMQDYTATAGKIQLQKIQRQFIEDQHATQHQKGEIQKFQTVQVKTTEIKHQQSREKGQELKVECLNPLIWEQKTNQQKVEAVFENKNVDVEQINHQEQFFPLNAQQVPSFSSNEGSAYWATLGKQKNFNFYIMLVLIVWIGAVLVFL